MTFTNISIMETKEELVEHIKKWVSIETEIKKLQQDLKSLRLKKKNLSDDLINVMRENEIDCFNINNGKLIHQKNKTRETISKKMLERCLSTYFQEDKQANDLLGHILDSRTIKEKDNIRIKLNKN